MPSSVKPVRRSNARASRYAAAHVGDLGQQDADVLGVHVERAVPQRLVDDLRAADVLLELDREALGLERLLVELAQEELLGEVLRADAQRRRLVAGAGGLPRRRLGTAAAAAEPDGEGERREEHEGGPAHAPTPPPRGA
jgi:hypothetical protein